MVSPWVVGIITVLVCLIVVAAGSASWYKWGSGWKTFTFVEGDYASWAPAPGKTVGGLRFRDVEFTILDSTGAEIPSGSTDATPTLNAMARAFAGDATTASPPVLSLVRPLNAFSFPITGLTDPANGAAFITKYQTGATPACTTEADCTPGSTNTAFPAAWAATPVPPPNWPAAPAQPNSLVLAAGVTAPANWLCYMAPVNQSSGCPALAADTKPGASSSTCGVTYKSPGGCFRAAGNPTTKLTGSYRSF
jgi:hypothetical protein